MKYIKSKFIVIFILTVLIFQFTIIPPVFGNRNQNGDLLQDAEQDVERTREQIEEFQSFLKTVEEEIANREASIEQIFVDIENSQTELENAREKMVESETSIANRMRLFASRLRSAYIKHNVSYLEVLFQAQSFSDMIVWWVYLTRILSNDARMIVLLEEEKESLAQERTQLEEKLTELQDLRNRLEAEQTNLAEQRKEKERLLADAQDRLGTELAELARLSPRAERKPIYSVVLDNYPGARPHHGINEASIVYEYEVEGSITRYLALFARLPNKVGPIRSARVPSALLALENDTAFIHAGGGIDVLQAMRNFGVRSVNELNWDGNGFFRDRNRRAPHNLYVNLNELGVAEQSEDIIWRPAFQRMSGGRTITNFEVVFNRRHTVSYTYDPEREAFRKSINGRLAREAGGRQIFARNVIVARVPYRIDLMLRPTAQLVGEGEMDFYSMGQHFRGRWKKDSVSSPTIFLLEDGSEIEKVFGQTWVHIVRGE